jgi:hypothetical protein
MQKTHHLLSNYFCVHFTATVRVADQKLLDLVRTSNKQENKL